MRTLTILYTNDVHGEVENLARAVYQMKKARSGLVADGHIVLMVDGGDIEERSVAEIHVTRGVMMYRLLKDAGYQASAVGNASAYVYGPDCLKDAAGEGVPLVCANLQTGGTLVKGTSPTLIFNYGDLKIGLTGVTDPLDGMYEVLHNIQATDPLMAVQRRAAELRAQGCHIVGLLSHLGARQDVEIAGAFPGVDFIIGGHSHDNLYQPLDVEGIPICQAGSHGNYWGRLDLELDIANRIQSWSGEIFPINDGLRMDQEMMKTWEDLRADLAPELDTPIARLSDNFVLDYTQPCPAGNLLASALQEATHAECALLLTGHLHNSVFAGDITRRMLCAALPSLFMPVIARLTGEEILDILRRGVQYRDMRLNFFRGAVCGVMQSAGLTYEVDGEQVENVRIGSLPLLPEQSYRVASTYFLYEVGQPYYTPDIDPTRFSIALHSPLQEVFERYLVRHYPPVVNA